MKLKFEHLTKIFPSRSKNEPGEVIAVNDFDFEIPDGMLVGLLGPSGCGKSTALNLICGLLSPSSGKIYFGENDVTMLPPENRGVGMVFQNYALYPHLTVRQNIMFPLQNLKGAERPDKAEMERRVLEAAKLVEIDSLLHRKPAQLSGGQQQRVAIARALVKRPGVLLLDEPLSNLDARLRLQTREEIRRIQRETKITTLFVTHDQEEAMSISDLIVVMKQGLVHQMGKPQQVYDDPVDLFVAEFLGTPPINIFRGMVSGGWLMLGKDRVLPVENVPDGEVTVGIRPEGFVPDREGGLRCAPGRVEVMGRDVSIVFSHESARESTVRAIVSAESVDEAAGDELRFSLKPSKVLLFDRESGARIRCEVG